MNFLAVSIKVLQLAGLGCSVLAAYWIPLRSYDNFINLFPANKAAEAYKKFRGGVWRQENGIITIPNYENIQKADKMVDKARLGYKLLEAGFIIQFIALALDPIITALDP